MPSRHLVPAASCLPIVQRRRPGALCLADPAAAEPAVADPALAESEWLPRTVIPALRVMDEPHSIRIPLQPGPVLCPTCETSFRAGGPTGYAGDRPICDLCLIERCEDLGMLMTMGLAVRAFANFVPRSRDEHRRALDELGIVARVYERFAERSGPPRPVHVAGAMGKGPDL